MTLHPHPSSEPPENPYAEPEGCQLFRQAIDRGDLQPGMTLTQNDLCRILGMSITPLRETLVLLQSYGLIEIKPRTGIRIVFPDVTFIRETFQFRILIEVAALRVFAQTDLSDWLAEMFEAHDRSTREMSDPGRFDTGMERFIATDRKFHASIVGVLDNRSISATHQRLQANIRMVRLTHKRTQLRQQLLDTVEEHRAVLMSLAEGDEDGAVAALEAHFRASTHRTFAA